MEYVTTAVLSEAGTTPDFSDPFIADTGAGITSSITTSSFISQVGAGSRWQDFEGDLPISLRRFISVTGLNDVSLMSMFSVFETCL